MTVEIINHDSNSGILDLTGGATEPENKDILDLTGGTEVTEVTEVTEEPDKVADGEEVVTPEEGKPDGGESTDTSTESDGEFFFNGQAVTVDVPEEINNALTEAGLDASTVINELFSKDGDFTLSEDTRQKLVDKFGATMVDGYLSLYKQQNSATLSAHESTAKEAQAEQERQGSEYVELVGGEEGLQQIESFILSNFDDNQIAAYNSVMESDSHASQMLILSQVKSQMEVMNKLKNGDSDIKLLGDDSAQRGGQGELAKGWLSSDEYQKIMETDKYWEDRDYQSQVDAARMAGLRK